jgi:hypothetical protein
MNNVRVFFAKYLPFIVGLPAVAIWMLVRPEPNHVKVYWIPIVLGLIVGSEAIARRLRKRRNPK